MCKAGSLVEEQGAPHDNSAQASEVPPEWKWQTFLSSWVPSFGGEESRERNRAFGSLIATFHSASLSSLGGWWA